MDSGFWSVVEFDDLSDLSFSQSQSIFKLLIKWLKNGNKFCIDIKLIFY